MQREAIKRLPSAHLALIVVALAGVVAIGWSFVRPGSPQQLPSSFTLPIKVVLQAALGYLLAIAFYELARFLNVVGGPEIGRYILKPAVVVESTLVLACTAVLVRGHTSRGLLAGLDVVLPAVVVVAVMSIAVSVATRRETTYVDRIPSESQTWFAAMILARLVACLTLIAMLGYLELQPLPNALVP
jgi:hypothetical protein